jgi:flagellar FliL protein
MPDTESPNATPAPSKGRSGLRTFVTVALSLCLVGMGYFAGMRGAPPAQPAVASEQFVERQEPEVGTIVDLDAVNVNLAGGHYLRIAVSLGLSDELEVHEPEDFPTAPAADFVLTAFAGRTVDELADPAGREAVREELAAALEQFYGDDIVAIYFTEFVMQ